MHSTGPALTKPVHRRYGVTGEMVPQKWQSGCSTTVHQRINLPLSGCNERRIPKVPLSRGSMHLQTAANNVTGLCNSTLAWYFYCGRNVAVAYTELNTRSYMGYKSSP